MTKLLVATFLSLALTALVHANKRISFSLIEQQGEEVLFLMVTEQTDGFYMYVGIGHGEPPIKLTEEEFGSLRLKLLRMKISEYESIIPPDVEENYSIILRSDYGGPDDSSTSFSVPKSDTPNEIKEWIELMKKTSGIEK